MASMLALVCTLCCCSFALAVSNSTLIAKGVEMPTVNIGGVWARPSNYSAWLELGGHGIGA